MEGINQYIKADEKVLYQTKEIVDKKFQSNFLEYFLISIGAGFFILNAPAILFAVELYRSPMMWLFIIIFGFLLFTGIFTLNLSLKHKRIILYITSKNVIKFINKGKFNRNPHIQKIELNNLDHIICWVDSIEFIPKRQNGEPYYNGTELKLSPEKRKNHITILLHDKEGQKINKELRLLLIKTVPMIEHPNNLKGLFISTQNDVQKKKEINK